MKNEKTETNRIGADFTVLSLALFAFPAFCMNVFTQIFRSLDDGLFISRFAGENALASLNLLNPLAGVLLALTHLFSLGASNISARLMGEGQQQKAKQVFTRVAVSGLVFGIGFGILVNLLAEPILRFLGADETLIGYGLIQIRIVYLFAPLTIVNATFNCYFATAGKPKMGMICSVVNGVVNIGLDVLLVAVLKMGVQGACLATVAGDLVVFLIGIFFYSDHRNEICFVPAQGDYIAASLDSARYALPQCINSISFAITTFLANKITLSMVGALGVSANAVVSDIRKILVSGLVGFAGCVGPVIAYNYGSRNRTRLKRILGQVATIWLVGSSTMMLLGLLLRKPLVGIFMSENSSQAFQDLSFLALTIEIFATPVAAGCIIMSRTFIALSKPKLATILSVTRNLVIKIIAYLAAPSIFGAIGIWLAEPIGEGLSCLFGFFLIYLNRDNLLALPLGEGPIEIPDLDDEDI